MANNHHRIHNPHDKMLFHSLKNKAIATDAMKAYLPSEISELLNYNQARPYKSKFVTPNYKQYEADIIYEVPMLDESALILWHAEQQTTVDKLMPVRMWSYMLSLYEEYYDNNRDKPLPLIFPVIIYTGEQRYTASTDLLDLFGDFKELARRYVLGPIKLVDVCRLSDDDIRKKPLFGVTELAFKYKKSSDVTDFMRTLFPWLNEVEEMIGPHFNKLVLRYVISEYDHLHSDLFMSELESVQLKNFGDYVMTIAEKWKSEARETGWQEGQQFGRQEGRQEGKEEGKLESLKAVARRMFKNGNSFDDIQLATDLPTSILNIIANEFRTESVG